MALLIVTLLSVASVSMVAIALSGSLAKVRHVELQFSDAAALNSAEAGLSAAISTVWSRYRDLDPADRWDYLDGLDGKYVDEDRFAIEDQPLGGGTVTVEVEGAWVETGLYGDVRFVARGESQGSGQSLTAIVRFERQPAQVFEYGYFIDNFGWLWGSGITVNGDVRANGNLSIRYATINGDVYAAENDDLGAAGNVYGTADTESLHDYNRNQGTRARPSNPSAPSEDRNGNGVLDPGEDKNHNGTLDEFPFTGGYDGESEQFEQQTKLTMPKLGDLTRFLALAESTGGTIEQDGDVLVDGVLGDDPGEEQNIVLVGTKHDPIEVSGAVVVMNDVVIKGYVTGQGTIYAGRNIHIVGDVKYANAPEWEKPLDDAAAAAEHNLESDLLGLASRGSIVVGNYTDFWWRIRVGTYIQPPFTAPYVVDEADDAVGYVSYYDGDGRPVFDGDYTAYDGGLKDDGVGGTVSRRYYESSLDDDTVDDAADHEVKRIDAILFTNHLIAGEMGRTTINGLLVARDEAILFDSVFTVNQDQRTRSAGAEYLDVFLPDEPSYRLLSWSTGEP